mmetsp:Transcript_4694/g.9997  ORF Transcript_4694/g.9997 Transcript_4694/m.9997 type:complete len:454 (-) Transcript_4694:45-1406(-)
MYPLFVGWTKMGHPVVVRCDPSSNILNALDRLLGIVNGLPFLVLWPHFDPHHPVPIGVDDYCCVRLTNNFQLVAAAAAAAASRTPNKKKRPAARHDPRSAARAKKSREKELKAKNELRKVKQEALSAARKEEREGERFDKMFKLLEAYKAEHGDCLVLKRTPDRTKNPERYQLGSWVQNIRRQFRRIVKGIPDGVILTRRQLARLVEINFVFDVDDFHGLPWDRRFELCQEFKKEHGHLRIPKAHPRLGSWVGHMRTYYAHNRLAEEQIKRDGSTSIPKNCLTPEREEKLTSLGFVWKIISMPATMSKRKPWDERFQDFLEFKRVHGHPFVGQKSPLGLWVSNQRVKYRKNQKGIETDLTPERVQQLKDAGFAFDASTIRRTPKSQSEVMEALRQQELKESGGGAKAGDAKNEQPVEEEESGDDIDTDAEYDDLSVDMNSVEQGEEEDDVSSG